MPSVVHVYLTPDSAVAGMKVRIVVSAYYHSPAELEAELAGAQGQQVHARFLPGKTQGNLFTSEAHFAVPDIGSNEASDDEFVVAVLPDVRLFEAGVPTGIQDLRISVAIPDGARYTWTDSIFTTPVARKSLTEWDFSSQPTGSITVNGVSLAAQGRDTTLTFLSGALLGIAGGAFVSFIQELRISGEPGRRRRRRQSDPSA
jgi:hypothetical protein